MNGPAVLQEMKTKDDKVIIVETILHAPDFCPSFGASYILFIKTPHILQVCY